MGGASAKCATMLVLALTAALLPMLPIRDALIVEVFLENRNVKYYS
jgi:hypothetical protein